jgi:hypothetical protein
MMKLTPSEETMRIQLNSEPVYFKKINFFFKKSFFFGNLAFFFLKKKAGTQL